MSEDYSAPPIEEKKQQNLIDNLMGMHMHEREAMFDVLTTNKDLFDKLIPGVMDLMTDPTQEIEHPLFRHYKEWARTPK